MKVNLNTIILLLSLAFSTGVYAVTIRGNSESIEQIKDEYAKKEILELHLEHIRAILEDIRDEIREHK